MGAIVRIARHLRCPGIMSFTTPIITVGMLVGLRLARLRSVLLLGG